MRDKGERLRILYLGPCNSDLALQGGHAASLSAVKWSRGLLHALKNEAEVRVITHMQERCWPKGRFLWGSADNKFYDYHVNVLPIGYPALPFVADYWLTRRYVDESCRLFAAGNIDSVVCYNCMQPYHMAVMREARRRGIPAVPIILDGPDPRTDNWARLLSETKDATAIAMLSWWVYKNFPTECAKLHLDGGAENWRGGDHYVHRKGKIRKIVYTGALARWSGADFLLDVIRKCSRKDVRFVICGKVEPGQEAAFRMLENVELLGFITEKELHEISCEAEIFLNIRDPKFGDNILNYPSKLPQYMAYGKAVVSNALASISPDYDDLLFVDCTNTVEGFLLKLNAALEESENSRAMRFLRMKQWFISNKTWSAQAKRLVTFLENLADCGS